MGHRPHARRLTTTLARVSDALLYVLLVAASYRVWHFFALDSLPPLEDVREPVLARITEWWGSEWADGLACAWCAGFWTSCAVVGATWALRPLALPGLWFLAVSAGVGIVATGVEA